MSIYRELFESSFGGRVVVRQTTVVVSAGWVSTQFRVEYSDGKYFLESFQYRMDDVLWEDRVWRELCERFIRMGWDYSTREDGVAFLER